MTAEKKMRLMKRVLAVLLTGGLLGLVVSTAIFFGKPSPTRASASLQLSFDGAKDGIAPNGVRFDISEITSDRILNKALEATSLNERYTADQIRPHLVVQGVYPDDMASQVMNYESLLSFTANRDLTVGDFHPTTFSITLYNIFDKKISRQELTALLQQIVTEYQTYFAFSYGYTLDNTELKFDLEKYDYPQQLDILETRLQQMDSYAEELQEKEPTFRFNGMGFGDIRVRLNNLIANDLARMSADLNMNGLTRDAERILIQYQYEVKNLLNQIEKKQAQLQNVDKLIASYEKNEIIYLSTAESLTKIDGNSSETYDFLVDERKVLADNITELKSEMDTYQLKMADLLKIDEPELISNVQDASSAQTEAAAEAEDSEPAAVSIGEGEAVAESTAATSGNSETGSVATTVKQEQQAVEVETAAATVTVSADTDLVTMTEEELAKAAEEAEALSKRRIAALESSIDRLVEKETGIVSDFQAMLNAYNEQEINEATVTASNFKYYSPSILSGAYIKNGIKIGGPIFAVAFAISMIMIITAMKKAEKEG